jgi:monoamine oxidase
VSKKTKGFTRRSFLKGVGVAGGSAALYETMTALGLINIPEAWAGPPELPQGSGNGKSVVILGAGIGGLTAAYELTRAGYSCQIIELTDRAGGRNHTARRGTVVHEVNEKGAETTQVCNFDEGLYLNLGPGRLPYHHRRVLHYCQELGVALEVYVMETMANLFQSDKAFGGKAQIKRRIANDMQGYISEMLAKAVNQKALDAELDEGDRYNLLCLLKNFGDLGQNDTCSTCGKTKCKTCNATSCQECASCQKQCVTCFQYSGSTRSGCEKPMTVYEGCEPETKLKLQELLSSEYWTHRFYQSFEYEWQPTLFQPVGGMDKIVDGFVRKVGSLIQYNTKVLDIQIRADGVTVLVENKGTSNKISANYCISNVPLPLLKNINNNFAKDFDDAVRRCKYDPTCKLGWQANRRFWESDKWQIYGGISYTDDPITQMWYPSYDYFTKNGTLTGVYNYDEDAIAFGNMRLDERIIMARKGAVKLHPEFADANLVPSDKAISIAWQNIPNEGGGWANWSPDSEEDATAYSRLLAPDRRFFVIGDQVSTLPGWQEGAMMSAQHVVEQIGGRRLLSVPRVRHAPNTRRLVQGRS